MNKTVTINISGIIFHIEEDAYDKLSKYLNTIKGYFSKNESGNEIIADIEARIAELLQAKVSQYKQVVLMTDVDDVINALGKPEDFGIEQENESKQSKHSATDENFGEPIKKRLYRDPDDKAIGGVCAGLAHYFDIDVVWIRLATFLLIFFGGVSLWVYIILWIVIPEAKTTADRLSMRGERINIDNISKSFKEEMEGVKTRMNSGIKNASHLSRSAADRAGYILTNIFMIVGRLIGAFLIFIAVMIMIGLMSSIFGFSIAGESAEFNDWINLIFIDRSHYWLGFIGLIITIGVPAFMLLYGGIKLLFKIKYSNRWLNISAGLIWFVGFIMALFAGVKTASDFGESSKYKETKQVISTAKVYTLSAIPAEQSGRAYGFEQMDEQDFDRHLMHGSDYHIVSSKSGSTILGKPKLRVVQSLSDKIEISVSKRSRGEEKRQAYERAKTINYNYSADSTHASFEEFFFIDGNQKFRVQEVEITVKVPKNMIIYFDKSLTNIINDVDNVTNTYDQDMLNRRWVMTDRGLECVDCEGIDNSEIHIEKEERVIINENGIKINDDGTKIVIDEKGININDDNHDIKLKKKKKDE